MVTVTDDPELAALTREFETATGRTVEDFLRDELRRRVPPLECSPKPPTDKLFPGYNGMTDEQKNRYDMIMAFVDACNRQPIIDTRTADEIIGYGEDGLFVP